ncbi:MAG: response regulator [Prevotellaceae bacterium]|nr:response regulator [Candidatus Minthosoma equi]
MSNSCIRNIYEDSRKNIWITTQNGLNRYDGVKMNVYRHDENDAHSLCGDDATCVLDYDRNHVLVGTGKGMMMYDYATDKFENVPILSESNDTMVHRIIGVYRVKDEGKEHVLVTFAGYGNGEVMADGNSKYVIRRQTKYNTGERDLNPIVILETHNYAPASEKSASAKSSQLWIINSEGKLYKKLANNKMKNYPEADGAVKMCESKSGNMYVATWRNGLYAYDKRSDSFKLVADAAKLGGDVYGLNAGNNGTVFVCTDGGGLRIYNEKSYTVSMSDIKINDFDLGTSNVKDAICDSYGNVWVGIYWKGVMMSPNTQSAFQNVGRHSITKNTIGTNSVFAMAEANDGKIWVAPDNDGLYLMNADGSASTHWNKKSTPGMPGVFTVVYPVKPMSSQSSSTAASTILLGTFTEGLWQMKDGKFSLLTKEIDRIFDIFRESENGFWIASMGNGFYYYNYATGKIIKYMTDRSDANNVKEYGNPWVYSILRSKNILYVATSDGLTVCKIDGEGQIKQKTEKILAGYSIKHIAASKDGKYVWAASNDGLFCVECNGLNTKRYTTAVGMPINSVVSLYVDGDKLWIGTDNGISCMDTKKETFANFFSDDGLQDNEFSRGALISANGNLYFGGISGITYFNPSTLLNKQGKGKMLELKFVDLVVNGNVVHKGDKSSYYDILEDVLDDVSEINLCSSDNHFAIELCVEGLSNQHVTFEYSIDDGEWRNQGSNSGRILFDNMEPGNYRIKIRALAFGVTSEEREISVTIHPEWYASIYAKIIYFILICVIIWLVYHYVRRQVKARRVIERHRQEQELNEARIQFFMDISHDVRTPMTLVMAPLDKLISSDSNSERQKNYSLMKENCNRILSTIDRMREAKTMETPTKYVRANVEPIINEIADDAVGGNMKHVVIVEDYDPIRKYLSQELGSDMNIVECVNGQQAWDYVVRNNHAVDLIISDVMMPVMDGLTLCQKVKSNFNTNHIPVMLLTARGSDADRIIGISNGADAYMSKPFNIDVLHTTAMGLINNRRLIHGKFKSEQIHEEDVAKIELESADENLMKRVMKVINKNMDNPELSVELIADEVGISRAHFYRKMKDLTGQGPRDFLKYIRLKEAARLLSEKKLDITGVSVATGFKSLSSFSTNFKALYGVSPSEYQKGAEKS